MTFLPAVPAAARFPYLTLFLWPLIICFIVLPTCSCRFSGHAFHLARAIRSFNMLFRRSGLGNHSLHSCRPSASHSRNGTSKMRGTSESLSIDSYEVHSSISIFHLAPMPAVRQSIKRTPHRGILSRGREAIYVLSFDPDARAHAIHVY